MIRSISSRGMNLRPWRQRFSLQPVGERAELALLELVVQVRDLGRHLLPELPGDDVPERVRREVADRADGPVHVLEHAEGVVRRLDAEIVPHPLVPDLRQLLQLDRVGQQLLLELEAEDDVQVVGRLVRLDADQRGRDPVDGAVPVVERGARERRRERSPAAAGRSGARTAGCGRPCSPTSGSATRGSRARRRARAACARARARRRARRARGRSRASSRTGRRGCRSK